MGTIVSQRVTACTVCGKPGIGYRRTTCSQDCADYARAHSVDQYERRKQRMSTWDRCIVSLMEAQEANEDERRGRVLARYIRRECERVGKTWSKREAIRRAGLAEQLPLTVAEVGSGKHCNGKALELGG